MEDNFDMEDLKKETVEQQRFIDLDKLDLANIALLMDTYATKKTCTAGFFNMALMATNSSQLKNLINQNRNLQYSIVNIGLIAAITVSLILQLIAGAVLLFLGKNRLIENTNIKRMLIRNNDLVTLVVFIIFILNIFINVFLNVT